MRFTVYNAQGRALYEGGSWPMARAALDYAVRLDEGCPRLEITPEKRNSVRWHGRYPFQVFTCVLWPALCYIIPPKAARRSCPALA